MHKEFNDKESLYVEPSALTEHVAVPLVMYVGGERHIIGEAVITNGQIETALNDVGLADKVMDMIIEQPSRSRFVFSFDADYVNEVRARYEPEDAILNPIIEKNSLSQYTYRRIPNAD